MTDSDNSQTVPERIAASVQNQFDSEDSRRSFLQRTAAAGGGLLLLGTGTTFAQQGDDQQEDDNQMFDDEPNTDVDVLNYILSVKRLQRDLYAQALEEFSADDFGEQQEGEETTDSEDGEETTETEEDEETTAPEEDEEEGNETSTLQETQPSTGTLYAEIEEFSGQKAEHVSILEQIVQLLSGQQMSQPDENGNATDSGQGENTTTQPDGGDEATTQPDDDGGMGEGTTQPEQEQSFEFEFEGTDDFLQTAAEVENTVVGAHAGVAGYVESPDLLNAVLSIYSVDARHAAVVNRAAGQPAAPEAFGQALAQSTVEEMVSQFSGQSEMDSSEEDGETDDESTEEGETGDEETTGSVQNPFTR